MSKGAAEAKEGKAQAEAEANAAAEQSAAEKAAAEKAAPDAKVVLLENIRHCMCV